MKKYLIYALLLYGAYYAGNRRHMPASSITSKREMPATVFVHKKGGERSLNVDSVAVYKGLQPAGIFLLE